jgi:hypothetical protein
MQRSVILLQSLAGSAFCFNAGTLLECEASESERLIDAGIARDLLSDEPTELQTLTLSRFPIVVDRSADPPPEPTGVSPGSLEPQAPRQPTPQQPTPQPEPRPRRRRP